MKPGPFLFLVGSIVVAALAAVGIFNTFTDPYQLHPSQQTVPVSDLPVDDSRYVKIQQFESGSYDGVLLGGSRAAFFSSLDLDTLGGHFYNFGLQSLQVSELESYARRVSESPSLKTAVIGLNFYWFSKADAGEPLIDLGVVEGTPRGRLTQFFFSFLSWQTAEQGWKALFPPGGAKPKGLVFMDRRGNYAYRDMNAEQKAKEWAKVVTAYSDLYRRYQLDRDQLAAVKRIKAVLEARGIRVLFYVSPISADLIEKVEQYCPADFDAWKRELADITDYYDFANRNSITENPENYYDPSHAKPEIGRLVFERMFRGSTTPADFGRYVPRNEVLP